jgi:hypothetical protein
MSDAIVRAQVLVAVRRLCGTRGFLSTLEQVRASAGVLPNHRLSQLATSLAWHADRPGAAERLREGAAELARLWARCGERVDGDGRLYLFLVRKLGLDGELEQLKREAEARLLDHESEIAGLPDARQRAQKERNLRPQMQRLGETIDSYQRLLKAVAELTAEVGGAGAWVDQLTATRLLAAEQVAAWRAELRLRLALAALQSVQALQNTRMLQEQIEEQEQRKGVFPWQ